MKVEKVKQGKLSLKNNGELAIFFVGTGSAFAKTLHQNNLLIIKGNNHILIDCGAKCWSSFFEMGVSALDIENYYITHSHADHIGGMEEFMMLGRYVAKKKPNLIISEEYEKTLWEESLSGGSAYSEIKEGVPLGLKDFCDLKRPTFLAEYPRETMEYNLGDLNIKMPRTKHVPDNAKTWQDSHPSYAVLLDDRILFTSDTRFDRDLLFDYDKKFQLEYIFHDCQLYTGGVHASLEELTTLPAEMKKKIVLMHYGDNWKDFEKQALKSGFHSWAQEHHLYSF